MKTFPHFNFEKPLWEQDFLVAGIDEVGRGSFAGPLVVAGVILHPITDPSTLKFLLSFGINDSKLISAKKRKMLKNITQEYILYTSIQSIDVDIINEKGIGKANKLGFQRVAQDLIISAKSLSRLELFFLTDAFQIPEVDTTRQKNIIRGDSTSITIALSSILAKIQRDTYMEELGITFPQYGFEKHKGYGTKFHREKIKELGACMHHRTEFVKHYI